MDKIRILIVDDSAFMRKSLEILLKSDTSIEIVGTARDGVEAVELAGKLHPDIITLDIEMPRMDGLTALKKIMDENPTPVIMVSSLTSEGAESTIKALELGAIDFIPKEMSYVNVNISKIKDDLIQKVKHFAKRKRLQKIIGIPGKRRFETKVNAKLTNSVSAIAIGISTGGPMSLQKIIPHISERVQIPIFIVQHMPPNFTKSLAQRLNSMSKLKVSEAVDGERIEKGHIYIAPGGKHMIIGKNGFGGKIIISDRPKETLHKPSVDVMISSAADIYKRNLMSVIMTGMGKDGLEGVKRVKQYGGYSLAQDEASCIIYGMPKAIVDNNLADRILSLERIPEFFNEVLLYEQAIY